MMLLVITMILITVMMLPKSDDYEPIAEKIVSVMERNSKVILEMKQSVKKTSSMFLRMTRLAHVKHEDSTTIRTVADSLIKSEIVKPSSYCTLKIKIIYVSSLLD